MNRTVHDRCVLGGQVCAGRDLSKVIGGSDEELVSADIIGSQFSALVDEPSTITIGVHTVKVLAWYDNVWGYARRVSNLAVYIANQL